MNGLSIRWFGDNTAITHVITLFYLAYINSGREIYVDDVISFLREAERKGIKSYHISSFLDWDYQFISSCNDYAFSIYNG